jgi:hypothetical protein
MRVAAPFMSGLIMYLLAVGGATYASRKTGIRFFNPRYLASLLLVFGVIVIMAVTPSQQTISVTQDKPLKTGPDDGPNQPLGKGAGINPEKDRFIFLTGTEYMKPLLKHIPENHTEMPMEGKRMGERMKWLNQQIQGIKEIVKHVKKIIYEYFSK